MQDLVETRGGGAVSAGAEKDDGFDALFFAHAGRLVRLARLLGDDDPEDVVQEAFCKLYAARSRLRDGDDTVVAYLSRIVVNEVRSRHRHRTVRRRDAHLFVERDQQDPHDRLGDRSAVVAALERLPHRQREVLVLRFWLDLPLHEIAEVMGVRLGTVKSQVSRGLDAVQSLLGEEVER